MKPATQLIATVFLGLILTGCESIPKTIWNPNSEPEHKPQPAAAPVETTKPAPSLHELIEQDLAAVRLSKPKGNNAIEKIERLRRQNPSDPAIPRYENAVIEKYLNLVDKRLKKNSPPARQDLERALRYINTARSLQVPSAKLDKKEEEIIELLDIVIQKEQLEKARAESATITTTETPEPPAEEPPQEISEPTAPQETATNPNPKINTPNFLALDQAKINARSQEINLKLDSISRRIIDENATVIIHAQSMNDFRYLSASLRTSLYWVDPDFNVSAEPHINQSVSPGIEIVVNE